MLTLYGGILYLFLLFPQAAQADIVARKGEKMKRLQGELKELNEKNLRAHREIIRLEREVYRQEQALNRLIKLDTNTPNLREQARSLEKSREENILALNNWKEILAGNKSTQNAAVGRFKEAVKAHGMARAEAVRRKSLIEKAKAWSIRDIYYIGGFSALVACLLAYGLAIIPLWYRVFEDVPIFVRTDNHHIRRIKSVVYFSIMVLASWLGLLYMLYHIAFPNRLGWDFYKNHEKPVLHFLHRTGFAVAILFAIFAWSYFLFSKF